ncbi:hypothetical protein ACFY7Z_00240 [Streptomyces sp. NPDC012623]|uniref:LppU/SCO3897 family protein n=1 Tax=unclassified Streptomyces TaxID=2593676 RepID=UPI003683F08D
MTTPPPPGPYQQQFPHPQPPQQPYPPQHPQAPYGPSYGQGYGPQAPYGPSYGPQAPYGQQQPYGPAALCGICGAGPAVEATVRGHEGMIIMMRSLRSRGLFCRSCGLATYRRMTSHTLAAGWWGLFSFFITPFVVLLNVVEARSRFRKLPPPRGGWRPPLDPGRRVLLRAPALLFLTPFALLVLAVAALFVIGVVAGDSGPDRVSVGDCVRNAREWPGQEIEAVSCDSGRAQYRVADGEACATTDYLLHPEYWAEGQSGLCVKRLS